MLANAFLLSMSTQHNLVVVLSAQEWRLEHRVIVFRVDLIKAKPRV